jgi:hypothetical protein
MTADQRFREPVDAPNLRDYLAAKAMAGMLVGCVGTIAGSEEVSAYAKGHCNSAIVDRAYAMADAMLAEREKSK